MDRLNNLLTCPLCHGYFRDAHVITSCMHTFCKSCLWLRLFTNRNAPPAAHSRNALVQAQCPTCRTLLSNSKATLLAREVKADRILQGIIERLLPEVFKRDAEDEAAFYRERNIALKERADLEPAALARQASGGSAAARSRPAAGATPPSSAQPASGAPALVLSFTLEALYPSQFARALDKAFLKTSRRLLVSHVQSYVAGKLGVPADELVIVCRGDECAPSHTVEFIKRTLWDPHDPHADMTLHFFRREPDP